jgi:hypothetical protein
MDESEELIRGILETSYEDLSELSEPVEDESVELEKMGLEG